MTEQQAAYFIELHNYLEKKRQEGYRHIDEQIDKYYADKIKSLVKQPNNVNN